MKNDNAKFKNKEGGVNSSPSFQGAKNNGIKKAKKPKPGPVTKDESLIEKNLKEGHSAYYSKNEDPLSQTIRRIVMGGDFSPKAIITEIKRTEREKINELRSRYLGAFEDGDFSLDNIKKSLSGAPDTITQKTFRDLKNEIAKGGDIISAKAIEELAGLEYFSEHLKRLEERTAETGGISEEKTKGELDGEAKNNIIKQKKNAPENFKPSINNQEKEKAEKQEKDKTKEIKPENKSEPAGSKIADINNGRKVEFDSDDEDSFDEGGAEPVKGVIADTEKYINTESFREKLSKMRAEAENIQSGQMSPSEEKTAFDDLYSKQDIFQTAQENGVPVSEINETINAIASAGKYTEAIPFREKLSEMRDQAEKIKSAKMSFPEKRAALSALADKQQEIYKGAENSGANFNSEIRDTINALGETDKYINAESAREKLGEMRTEAEKIRSSQMSLSEKEEAFKILCAKQDIFEDAQKNGVTTTEINETMAALAETGNHIEAAPFREKLSEMRDRAKDIQSGKMPPFEEKKAFDDLYSKQDIFKEAQDRGTPVSEINKTIEAIASADKYIETKPIREFEEKYAGAKNAKSQSEKGAKLLAAKEYARKTNPDIINEIEEIKDIKDAEEKLKRNKKLNDMVKKEAKIIMDLAAQRGLGKIGKVAKIITPLPASAPSPAFASIHIPIPAPTPQTSSPSQGSGKSSNSQGGKISIKSAPSDAASSASPQTSPASSAPSTSIPKTPPARAVPSTPASQTSPASPQTTNEPASTPASASQTAPSPQTASEPVTKPASAQSQVLSSQDSAKSPIDNQDSEISTKPAPQAPLVSQTAPASQAAEPTPAQSSPDQNLNASPQAAAESASTHTPAPPSAAAPAQPQASPAKTPPQSQGSTEPATDNAQKEDDEEMSEEDKIKKIKEAVEKKIRDSLEKNIDNGMGGIAIQDEAGNGDAARIKMIKDMAERESSGNKRNRINLINSAIKADSIRVDPADREAEAQRIRKEAEEKVEKELKKNVKGYKAKIASRVLGEAAYRIATELAKKANKGGSWAFFVFLITLGIAIIIDFLDIFGELLIETIVGTIIIFLICTALSLINTFFWLFVLGGGHPKWFWKVLIRMLVGFFIVESIPILELLPFTVIIVCWNWHDYTKERNEAKKELKTFVAKNKSLLKNVSAN